MTGEASVGCGTPAGVICARGWRRRRRGGRCGGRGRGGRGRRWPRRRPSSWSQGRTGCWPRGRTMCRSRRRGGGSGRPSWGWRGRHRGLRGVLGVEEGQLDPAPTPVIGDDVVRCQPEHSNIGLAVNVHSDVQIGVIFEGIARGPVYSPQLLVLNAFKAGGARNQPVQACELRVPVCRVRRAQAISVVAAESCTPEFMRRRRCMWPASDQKKDRGHPRRSTKECGY